MNKKIMMSGLSIVSALTLLGGTAFAAFTGSAVASNNTFSTGAADLKISSDNVNYSGLISNPFNGAGIAPGYNHTFTFYLQNNGSDPLSIVAKFNGGTVSLLDDVLVTDFACNNGADPAAYNVTAMRGGSVSLGDLPTGAMTCTVNVILPNSVDNTYQNLTSNFDVVFEGTQVTP